MELEQQMINLFVRLEVQRRYFNICGFEMLSKCFGMQEPSALEALTNKKTEISIDRLLTQGRGLTVDQYLEAKNDLKKDEKLRDHLMAGRESFVVFKENGKRQVTSSQFSNIFTTSNTTASSQNRNIGMFNRYQ